MTAPVESAAEAAAEVVQKAALPVAFLAILIGSALAVAAIVKRFGQALPLPDYMTTFATDEPDEPDTDNADTLEYTGEQWD